MTASALTQLQDLAIAVKAEMSSNFGWLEDGAAFGGNVSADLEDAQFHLRALWRLLVLNNQRKLS